MRVRLKNSAPDFYALREERLVLQYFQRKALGDFSVPVPDLTIFEHVAAVSQPLFAMACERELRALFLAVGDPLTVEMCAELLKHTVTAGYRHAATAEVSHFKNQIGEIENEISRLWIKKDELEDELDELESKVFNKKYVPADASPLVQQLERQGA